MQLAYAFLSHAAEFSKDGKLYVLGGDFDTIHAATFPAVHVTMSLVVKLSMASEDFGVDHKLTARLAAESGATIGELTMPISLPKDPERTKGRLGLVVHFVGAEFPAAGEYVVTVSVDDREMGRVPLLVVQTEAK